MKLVVSMSMAAWLTACGEPPWPRVVPDPASQAPPTHRDTVAIDAAEDRTSSTTLLDEGALAALAPLLSESDKVHAALVADTLSGVATAGAAIASAAKSAAGAVTDPTIGGYLAEIAKQAPRLGESDDIEVVRVAYGDLSKPLVALASAVPALRGARKVFFCPMTKGYPKWLQAEPSLRNPYYGSKMLTCGEETDWSP